MAETNEKRKPCNSRLDELAKPNKRLVYSLWESYAYIFSPERREAIRLLLQELYAMTPEETSKYFDQINKILKKRAAREQLRKRLLKKYKIRKRIVERKRAFLKFKHLLIKGMTFASKNPIPAMVSPRLRTMSDVILEQLCDIRCLGVPDRTDTDTQAQFLLNVADWLAMAIEHIYYEIQVHKNRELDAIEEQIRAEEAARKSASRKTRSRVTNLSNKASKSEVETK